MKVIDLGGLATLYQEDCVVAMRALPDNSIDSCVTDPPYHLTSIVKRFGGKNAAPAQFGTDGAFARASKGFMSKTWDGGDIAFRVELWAEVWRVLKPGGWLVAFSATRTYHRMAVAIEDAGFEIRDQLGWLYGSGFPKSHDVSKAIDKAAGAEREVVGTVRAGISAKSRVGDMVGGVAIESLKHIDITAPATDAARQWQGWGTALKPAWEPICLARKPLVGTVAENVLKHGTGALNIDGCRVPMGDEYDPTKVQRQQSNRQTWEGGVNSGFAEDHVQSTYNAQGRWPANIVHDGSDEVLAAFPSDGDKSAARFFYCAKASRKDRDDGLEDFPEVTVSGGGGVNSEKSDAYGAVKANRRNTHPTVKPTDLMRWLCRLVTPPGGVILDPFMGSGSTGKAALLEGFRFIGCEREDEYMPIAEARIAAALRPIADNDNQPVAAPAAVAANSNQPDLFGSAA